MVIDLHIGVDGPATRRTQARLRAGRQALRQHGILYPTATQAGFPQAGHRVAALYGGREPSRRECRPPAALMAETEAAAPQRLILSDRALARLSITALARVRDGLASLATRIRVRLHLVRQDDVLLHAYPETVAAGSPLHLADLAHRAESPHPSPDALPAPMPPLDYEALRTRLARVFGAEAVHVLTGPADTPPDLDLPVALPEASGDTAALPDAAATAFLRRLNERAPVAGTADAGATDSDGRTRMAAALAAASDGTVPGLPASRLDAFMARFEEGNARLFGNGATAPFPAPRVVPHTGSETALDTDTVVRLTVDLARHTLDRGTRRTGDRLAEHGQLEPALAILRHRVTDVPGDGEAWAQLGRLLAGAGRMTEARDVLAEARAAGEDGDGAFMDALWGLAERVA